MYDNWAEVNRQLGQELQRERAQRQAHRRQQPRFHWSLLRWWQVSTSVGSSAPNLVQKDAQTSAQTKLSPRNA